MFWLNSREEHSLASHHPPWSWALPTFRWASNSPPVISLQCEHLGRLLLDLTSSLNEGDNNFRHQDASWREATSVRHLWRRYKSGKRLSLWIGAYLLEMPSAWPHLTSTACLFMICGLWNVIIHWFHVITLKLPRFGSVDNLGNFLLSGGTF